MSRCFPFPPPGYEKNHAPEDLDVLKEAKRKEKKHRKDKKDKERKKDKEKEKDGSNEKQRDKKDRKGKHKDKKEKHRDKKDKEDRSKDKEKSSISEESTVSGKLVEKSGEKPYPTGHSKDRSSVDEAKKVMLYQGQNGVKPSQSSMPSQGTEESKFVWELERRINGDNGRKSQLPEGVADMEPSQGRMPSQGTEKSKLVRELDRRINDVKGRKSQLPDGVVDMDNRNQETETRAAVKNSSRLLEEEKSDNKDSRVHNKKMDLQGFRNEPGGNAIVQNLAVISKSKVEGIPRPLNEQNNRRLEGEEKLRETGDSKRGDKRKDRDKNHGHEKEKEKDKKKEEKVKVKTENKKREKERLKEVGRNDIGGVTSNKSTDLLKDVNSSAEGNIRKRKDMDTLTNGFLHESEIGPNKMQRTAPRELTENGRTSVACATPSESSYEKHAIPNSVGMDKADRLINGIIKAQKPSSSKHNSSAATMVSDQRTEVPKIPHRDNETLILSKMENDIAKASRRPPHPDSRYLQEVLTVPNVGDWSENDDQEWLFGKKDPSDKPKVKAHVVNEERVVWSEARYIETADICALPYVIPY